MLHLQRSCLLVPDAHQIFQNNSDALALSTSLLSSLRVPVGGRFETLDIAKQSQSFSGWGSAIASGQATVTVTVPSAYVGFSPPKRERKEKRERGKKKERE